MNVVHNHCLVLCHSGSADSLIRWNADMFGWRSAKSTQDKRLRIGGIEHIEARPVVVGQALWNNLDDEVLQRGKIVCGVRKCTHFGKNLGEGVLDGLGCVYREDRRH